MVAGVSDREGQKNDPACNTMIDQATIAMMARKLFREALRLAPPAEEGQIYRFEELPKESREYWTGLARVACDG